MTANMEKALRAVLSCKNKREAAAAAGITERTLRGYFQQYEFRKAYQEAMNDLVQTAEKQAKASLSSAISVLLNIATDEQVPSAARISAARSLLEYGLKLGESNPRNTMEIFDL